MNWAGDFADLCLYRLMEQSWACKAAVREKFGVLEYLRFRDDVFIIGIPEETDDHIHGMRKFIGELIRRAARTQLVDGSPDDIYTL